MRCRSGDQYIKPMPPRQKDPLRLSDQWCDSPELHACSTSSCRLGRGQVSACQLRPAPACVQVARGPEMEGDGASMPLPSAGGTTDAPSGSKSGGIKGFFSKLGGGRKVTKPDAPVAAAAVPAGVEKLASVPTAGKFFFSCIVWLCLCIDTSERLVVKVLAACAGAQMPSSSGPGFREMLVDPNDESAAPTKFTGGSMPSGGTVFVWEGTGPMPAGGPPVPGPDGSLPAGWKKVEWDGTGPPPPELSGAPAAAVGATYPWQGSGPMPAGGPGSRGEACQAWLAEEQCTRGQEAAPSLLGALQPLALTGHFLQAGRRLTGMALAQLLRSCLGSHCSSGSRTRPQMQPCQFQLCQVWQSRFLREARQLMLQLTVHWVAWM